MTRAALLIAMTIAIPAAAQRDPGWEVRSPDKLDLQPAVTGTLPIAIAVDRGLTISKDAGLTIDLVPDAGVVIRKRRLGRGDAADPDADGPRFAVPIRADAAGDYAVKLRIRFWLCGGKVCRPVDTSRTVTVSVHRND
jgi:hypothetical protein